MIPESNVLTDFEIISVPTRTYNMRIAEKRIAGTTDDKDALIQSIYRILNTERYIYPIYSWNYGIELADLYGKSRDYIVSELKRRITDALSADERISSVGGFDFAFTKNEITCSFIVHSIYGDIETEKRVNS